MRHSMRIISFSGILLVTALLQPFLATAQWKQVELSGSFEGISDTKGDGVISYSFALARAIPTGGDITFTVDFGSSKETKAILSGGTFFDLGALATPPSVIKLPKDLYSRSLNYTIDKFLVGHYYYMRKGPLHVLLQVLDFTPGTRSTVQKHWYGTREKAKATLGFRYISTTSGLEELNDLLSGTSIPKKRRSISKTTSEKATPQAATRTRSSSNPPEPLLAEYEGFQKSTSSFLDLPLDQVSVVKCDQLIDTGTAVKSKVGQEITSLHEQVREGTADVEKYKDRIERITNLQLKDRVTTKINQLEVDNQERRVNLKQWEARLNELSSSLMTLREYRDILK